MLFRSISAQAFGVDVFGFFAHWTDETFYFSGGTSQTQQTKSYPLAIGESAEYESLEEALSEFQIDSVLAPSWYPEGIGALTVSADVSADGMRIYAVSDSENPFVSLSISDFDTEVGPPSVIEKDGSTVTPYEAGGCVHYIMSDGKWCKATWIVDNLQCIVRSNIPEDEMLKIIDSIYEVS